MILNSIETCLSGSSSKPSTGHALTQATSWDCMAINAWYHATKMECTRLPLTLRTLPPTITTLHTESHTVSLLIIMSLCVYTEKNQHYIKNEGTSFQCITLTQSSFLCNNTCWPSPSNQSFYRKLPATIYQRGMSNHRVDLNWGAFDHESHAPQLRSCNYV
jgi:hypothetical protein